MKKTLNIITVATIAFTVLSCGNGGGNTNTDTAKVFNPQERTSSSKNDKERAEAIARKKSELNIDVNAMMASNGVKLSILPPQPAGDITEGMSELIALKMLQIIADNGIGGINTVPGFALGATITPGERKVTNTAPQKMAATYTLGYKVINLINGDVYAATSEEITGVGGSFEEATRNAVKSIKNSSSMQQALAEGSKKIIEWFEGNLATFKLQVDNAYSKEDYALALALIESVPQKAATAFEYAQGRHKDILEKFQHKIAVTELAAIRQAIALSPDSTIVPEPYAHLQMLPLNSPEYKQAEKLLADYEAQVIKNRLERIQRRQAKADADAARQAAKADADAQRENAVKLAEIEAGKIKAQYQAAASEESYKKQLDVQRGFWGNLGARIIEAID